MSVESVLSSGKPATPERGQPTLDEKSDFAPRASLRRWDGHFPGLFDEVGIIGYPVVWQSPEPFSFGSCFQRRQAEYFFARLSRSPHHPSRVVCRCCSHDKGYFVTRNSSKLAGPHRISSVGAYKSSNHAICVFPYPAIETFFGHAHMLLIFCDTENLTGPERYALYKKSICKG